MRDSSKIEANNYPSSIEEWAQWYGTLTDDQIAIRDIPLRALFALAVLKHCEGRPQYAARMLGISAPAISTLISRFEMFLGTDVVKRASQDGRRFEFTQAGSRLVSAIEDALPSLLDISVAIREARNLSSPEKRHKKPLKPRKS